MFAIVLCQRTRSVCGLWLPSLALKVSYHCYKLVNSCTYFRAAFLFRHPKAQATFEVFFLPLDKVVWCLIAVSLGVIILVMKCIIYYEYVRKVNPDIDVSWSAIVLFLIGAVCQQGSPTVPDFISGRILTLFVFVFAILINQFYSASLVSKIHIIFLIILRT